VKKAPLMAILATGFLSLAFVCPQAMAENPAATPARQPNFFSGKVVLLDVNYIFKNHARFNALMDQMKNDADELDKQMKFEESELRKKAAGLQKLNPGSAEFKNLEEDLTRTKTDLSLKYQQKRREFLMREAKIHNDTYKEIEDQVDYFCQSNGILMVLRFMGDPVVESNPDSILSNINKPVVWYNKELDITPYILKRFIGQAKTATSTNSAGGGNRNAPSAPYQQPR
jgi:Skp family chaperone for outer membrane proteins